jgi:hypothetical protein
VSLNCLGVQGLNGKWYVDLHRKIFATGKIKPNPILILPNGIADAKDGLQNMQEGKVRPMHNTC